MLSKTTARRSALFKAMLVEPVETKKHACPSHNATFMSPCHERHKCRVTPLFLSSGAEAPRRISTIISGTLRYRSG